MRIELAQNPSRNGKKIGGSAGGGKDWMRPIHPEATHSNRKATIDASGSIFAHVAAVPMVLGVAGRDAGLR